MAKYVECDRCGARRRSVPEYQLVLIQGGVMTMRVPVETWDICRQCMEALSAWVAGGAE